ncbi:MAG: hypothetical protein ACYC5K_13020 [Saccharofermentanales bacterium]
MEWWAWVLIALGVVVIGSFKLYFFKKIMEKRASRKKFTDED